MKYYPLHSPGIALKPKNYFIKTDEYRTPKKGEYYLSGAIPEVYKAPNDLPNSYEYWIMKEVKLNKDEKIIDGKKYKVVEINESFVRKLIRKTLLEELNQKSLTTIQMDMMGSLHIWKGDVNPTQTGKYLYKANGKEADIFVQNSDDVNEIVNGLSKTNMKKIKNGETVKAKILLSEADMKPIQGKSEDDIIQFFKDHIKKFEYYYQFSESGDSFDLIEDKNSIKYIENILNKNGFLYVNNDFGEDDDKGTLKKKFKFDIEKDGEKSSVNAGNTYNHSWLFPTDVNWRLFKLKNNKLLLEVRIHLGGDARANYSGGYYKIISDRSYLNELLLGNTVLTFLFDDKSSISYNGQDSDVNNFDNDPYYTNAKTYEHKNQIELFGKQFHPVEGGIAPILAQYTKQTFGKSGGYRSGLDNFLFELTGNKI